RPTPAKFSDCGRRNGNRGAAAALAPPAFGAWGGCATSSARTGFAAVAALTGDVLFDTAFFLAIAGNPTRRWAILRQRYSSLRSAKCSTRPNCRLISGPGCSGCRLTTLTEAGARSSWSQTDPAYLLAPF